MHHPRTLVLAAALLVAAPVLGSCGFDYATDRVNTVSAGVNDRAGDVDVLGTVIVADRPESGTLITTLSNSGQGSADALVSVTAASDDEVTAGGFAPIDVPASGAVNLAEEGGVRLTGGFGAGDFVGLVIGFESGQTTTVEIPVVRPCFQYEGLDNAPQAEGQGDDPAAGEEYSCEPAESSEG